MLIDQLKIAEGSTIINLSFPSGTTFPTSVQIGEVFYRTDQSQAYVYNGTAWDKITDVSASQYKTYDIPLQKTGTIPVSSTLMFFVAARQTTIPANFAGSYAAVGSISAATTFTVKRNNIAIGTIAFTAGGVETFTSTVSGDIVLVANDSLSIVSSTGTMPTDLAITIQAVIDGSPPAIDGSSSVVAGSVTSVSVTSSDLNVTGNPITSEGVIDLSLKATAVTPGSYTYSSLTVDSKGRLTAAASGTPVTSFNTRFGAVSLTANDVISVLGLVPTDNEGTVKSVGLASTDFAVSGGPITSTGNITANLNTTAVTPGSYTYSSITVDSKGRLTAAASGTPVVTFNGRSGAVNLASTDISTALGFTPASTLDQLSNVLISSGTMGQVLTLNSITGKWQNGTIPSQLPAHTGNSGKYLTSNGSVASWAAIPAGNVGTVTSVGLSSTDFAVSGGPITSSGNITADLNTTAVTAGVYTYGSFTVDSKGRLTDATSNSPVVSFNGRTGAVSLGSGDIQGALGFLPAASLAQLGTVTLTSLAVGQVLTYSAGGIWRNVAPSNSLPTQTGNTGKYLTTNGTAASWATLPAGNVGTVTSVDIMSTDFAVSGGPITSSGNITANLNTTAVTAGSYTFGSFTVDSKGRLTAAASGTPVTSFNTRTGAITLTSADVTTALGYTPGSGTGTVSSVNVAGGTTGLSFTGGPVTTTGTITMAGTLAITNGGTGSTTATAALTNLLPTQTANTGKVLTTNGTAASWATPTIGTVTSVGLSSTDFAVSGGPITSSGNITANLNTTAVTAGSYTFGSFTVDSKGRLTSAASGTPVTSFNTRTGAVTLGLTDVTTALGFTPFSSASGIGTLPDVLLTTPATGDVLSFDLSTNKWKNVALASELPAQSGMSGKLLTTNGSAASWGNTLSNLSVGGASVYLGPPVSYPLQSVSTGTSGVTLARFSNDTNAAQMVFLKSRSTTPGTYNGPVLSNDYLGFIAAYGDDGTTAAQGPSLSFYSTEAWDVDSHGADIRFHTVQNGSLARVERLRIMHDGRLALGTTSAGAAGLSVNNPLSGSTTAMGVRVNATIMSDVTGTAYGFRSTLTTEAAAFTLPSLSHYVVESSAGAGSTITTQIGYSVPSGMTAATTNIAFNGNLAYSSTKTNWNFYGASDAWNLFTGNTGVGTTPALGQLLRVGGTGRITGATTAYAVVNNPTVASDVTTAAVGYSSHITTTAAAFTLPSLIHFNASPNTIGAGSTITNQYGFYANSNLTAATNNYGFFSNIQSGTGRWNFYALNSAANYFNGTTLIGSDVSTIASTSTQKLQVHASAGAGASLFRWANDTGSPDLRLVKSRSTTMGTLGTPALAGDGIGSIWFIGDNGTASTANNAGIQGLAAEDFTSTATGTHLRFYTTAIGTTPLAERLRISATGNVLIGTTTDDGVNKLQVSGSIVGTKLSTGAISGASIFAGTTDVTPDYPVLISKSGTSTTTTGVALGSNNTDRSSVLFTALNTTSTHLVTSRIVGLNSSATAGTEKGYLVFDTKGAADASPVGRLTLSEISASFTVPVLSSALTVGSALSSDTIGAWDGTAITPQLQVNNAARASVAIIDTGLAAAYTKPTLALVKKHGPTFTSAVSAGESLGSVEFHGANGTAQNTGRGAVIEAIAATTFSDSFATSLLSFSTSTTGGLYERMRISDTGNLLIGTTTDAGTKLNVAGDISLSGALYANASPGSSGQVLVSAGSGAPARWKSVKAPAITTTGTSTSSATVDFTNSDIVRLVLQANVTTLTISGAVDGQMCLLEIIQDAIGNRTLAWPANTRRGTDVTATTISTGANKKDRFWFYYDAATSKYDLVQFARGF